MNRIVLKSKVSSDGVLHLTVPLRLEDAEKEVNVIVERIGAKRAMPQEEWQAWVDSMAGAWQGGFEPGSKGR
jgi:hypothetical protein